MHYTKKFLFVFVVLLILSNLPTSAFSESVSFVVISDLHYSVDNANDDWKMLGSGRKILPSVLKSISKMEDVDFVIFTGDLFVDPHYPELEKLRPTIDENLSKPYFVVPGNHDRSTDEQTKNKMRVFSIGEFVSSFQGHPYTNNEKSYWSMDFKGYHLIGLDSTRADTWEGEISGKQYVWLKNDLKQNRNKFTIIFLHHSFHAFYPEHRLDKEFLVGNNRRVKKLLSKNPQAKFVVSGHYHFPAVSVENGVHYFSMPTIITYPCEYGIFTVDKNAVKYKAVHIGDAAYIDKAKLGLISKDFWRNKFDTDEELLDVFDGIRSYRFNLN